MPLHLVIGNKNYSTWSLRPWLLLSHFKIKFLETAVSLEQQDLPQVLSQFSPSNRVPVLTEQKTNLAIWDSLAICEYVNECYLEGAGWPENSQLRAYGRSISSEMHAGFSAVRNAMPMNIRAKRAITFTEQMKSDITRIDDIWSAAHGHYLLGDFSIADCMYAPVVFRFETYHYPLSSLAEAYRKRLLAHPAMSSWREQALKETEIVAIDEAGKELH